MKRVVLILLAVLTLAVIVAGALWWRHDRRARSFYTDGSNLQQSVSDAVVRDVLWLPPVELAGQVNSGTDEYEPRISLDGSTLVLVRGKAGGDADLFVAQREQGGNGQVGGWAVPQPIFEVNTHHDELAPAISPDGRTLVFSSNRPGGQGGYDLWLAHRADFGWGEPVNLGPTINSEYNEYGPAISPDSMTLVFASNRPAIGETPTRLPGDWSATVRERYSASDYDLYTAAITPEGFTQAEPIVALNTPANEGAPVFSPAGDFVYFCSDRIGGAGGFDIYRSRRLDDRQLAAERLGGEINTPANEMDPAPEMAGFALVFSSDRSPGAAIQNPESKIQNPDPDYNLWRSESREVFVKVGPRGPVNWAGLWALLAPLVLWLLLLLLGLALLGAMWKGVRSRRLSLLMRCLLASLIAHVLLMIVMSFWQVTSQIAQLMDTGGGMRIQLTSAAAGSGGIAGQVRGGMTDVGGIEAQQTASAGKFERNVGDAAPDANLVSMQAGRSTLADQQGEIEADPNEAQAQSNERPDTNLAVLTAAARQSQASVTAPADEMKSTAGEAAGAAPSGEAGQVARTAQAITDAGEVGAPANVAIAPRAAAVGASQPLADTTVRNAAASESNAGGVDQRAVVRSDTSRMSPVDAQAAGVEVARPGQGEDARAPQVAEAGAARPSASGAPGAGAARADASSASDNATIGTQAGAVAIAPQASNQGQAQPMIGVDSRAANAAAGAPDARSASGATVPMSTQLASNGSANAGEAAGVSLPSEAASGGAVGEAVAAVPTGALQGGVAARSSASTTSGAAGTSSSTMTELEPSALASAAAANDHAPTSGVGGAAASDATSPAGRAAGDAPLPASGAQVAANGSAGEAAPVRLPTETAGGGITETEAVAALPTGAMQGSGAARSSASTAGDAAGANTSAMTQLPPGALARSANAMSDEQTAVVGGIIAGDSSAPSGSAAGAGAALPSSSAQIDAGNGTDTVQVAMPGEGVGAGAVAAGAATQPSLSAPGTALAAGSSRRDASTAAGGTIDTRSSTSVAMTPGAIDGGTGASDGALPMSVAGTGDAEVTGQSTRSGDTPASDRALGEGMPAIALGGGALALPSEVGGGGDSGESRDGQGTPALAAAASSSSSRSTVSTVGGTDAASSVVVTPGAAGGVSGGDAAIVGVGTQAIADAGGANRSGAASEVPSTGRALGDGLSAPALAAGDLALPAADDGGAAHAADGRSSQGSRDGTAPSAVAAAGANGRRDDGGVALTDMSASGGGAAVHLGAAPAERAGETDGLSSISGFDGIAEARGADDGLSLDAALPAMALGEMNMPGSADPDIDIRIPTEILPPNNPYAARAEDNRLDTVKRMGGSEETERAVSMALEWLARHQSADGRWATRGFDDSCGDCKGEGKFDTDIATTGLALLCFLGADHTHFKEGKYQQHVQRGLTWLLSQQKADGDLRGGETMYSHGIASIALGEAFGMTSDPKLREPVQKAIDFIDQARNRNVGGWRYEPRQAGDTSVAGWQVMAMMSAKRAGLTPSPDAFAAAGAWMETVSFPDMPGRYAYQPGQPWSVSMSAEGMFIGQLLGMPRVDARMSGSVAYIMENLPNWDVEPNTYYWYYATLAMFQYQGPQWDAWNKTMTEMLLKNQRQSGAAAGSYDPRDNWSKIGGRVYQTAICTLCLEVYYRYLPMYRDAAISDARSAVTGLITDARTGQPLAGATVRLDLSSTSGALVAVTDSAGRYALALPALPADFVALSASKDGYTPSTTNIAAAEADHAQVTRDFVLAPQQSNVIAIETDPQVHHLGNNEFEGSINSQFQKQAEGLAWEAEFALTEQHLPPHTSRAQVVLMVKGAQAQNSISINGRRLGTRMNRAPRDGSFGEFVVDIPIDQLTTGVNTITIRSSNSEVDYDDFEFVNVQIRLE